MVFHQSSLCQLSFLGWRFHTNGDTDMATNGDECGWRGNGGFWKAFHHLGGDKRLVYDPRDTRWGKFLHVYMSMSYGYTCLFRCARVKNGSAYANWNYCTEYMHRKWATCQHQREKNLRFWAIHFPTSSGVSARAERAVLSKQMSGVSKRPHGRDCGGPLSTSRFWALLNQHVWSTFHPCLSSTRCIWSR